MTATTYAPQWSIGDRVRFREDYRFIKYGSNAVVSNVFIVKGEWLVELDSLPGVTIPERVLERVV